MYTLNNSATRLLISVIYCHISLTIYNCILIFLIANMNNTATNGRGDYSDAGVPLAAKHKSNPDSDPAVASPSSGATRLAEPARKSPSQASRRPPAEMGEHSKRILDKLLPLIHFCKAREQKSQPKSGNVLAQSRGRATIGVAQEVAECGSEQH